MEKLKNMINHKRGYNRFDKLANYLMNVIQSNKDNKKYKYELMEIEFYFYTMKKFIWIQILIAQNLKKKQIIGIYINQKMVQHLNQVVIRFRYYFW